MVPGKAAEWIKMLRTVPMGDLTQLSCASCTQKTAASFHAPYKTDRAIEEARNMSNRVLFRSDSETPSDLARAVAFPRLDLILLCFCSVQGHGTSGRNSF